MLLDAAGCCVFTKRGLTQKDQFTKHFMLAAGTGRHNGLDRTYFSKDLWIFWAG